jgi:hypothetical protein
LCHGKTKVVSRSRARPKGGALNSNLNLKPAGPVTVERRLQGTLRLAPATTRVPAAHPGPASADRPGSPASAEHTGSPAVHARSQPTWLHDSLGRPGRPRAPHCRQAASAHSESGRWQPRARARPARRRSSVAADLHGAPQPYPRLSRALTRFSWNPSQYAPRVHGARVCRTYRDRPRAEVEGTSDSETWRLCSYARQVGAAVWRSYFCQRFEGAGRPAETSSPGGRRLNFFTRKCPFNHQR